MKTRILIITLLMAASAAFAQEVIWFPSKINIQPFKANFLEPKAGFDFHLNNNRLRLDIGTSRDFYQSINARRFFSFGADLFTFTRIIRGSDFHFPVETVDYLFGLNAGYRVTSGCDCDGSRVEYGMRLRLSHISAHLVDGKFDNKINDWKDGDKPRVYSREFVELMPYYLFHDLRVYAGLTYLIHVSPHYLNKDSYQLGFDYFASNMLGLMISPFAAYDFKLEHINKYQGNNIFTAGIKFGNARGEGVSLAYSYISGRSIHGEYFDKNESYSTVGFNIDL